MYGDYSRLTDDPTRHYTGVWTQQGRVQLDSDANELTAILLREQRQLAIDLFGPVGARAAGAGFGVHLDPNNPNDLVLDPGYYYVHGLRCELLPPRFGDPPHSYRAYGGTSIPPLDSTPYVVELVVWEQMVTAASDPHLIEPALGAAGADVSTRSQLRWQLATTTSAPWSGQPFTGSENKNDLVSAYVEANVRHPRLPSLRARVSRSDDGVDLQSPLLPRSAGYRRPENQLYRVEIHSGGRAEDATMKWSRDNGSVVFDVASVQPANRNDESVVTLAGPAGDSRAELAIGDWVELRDDSWSPLDPPTALLEVRRFSRVLGEVTLAVPVDHSVALDNPGLHPVLRRWDQRPDQTGPDNAIAIAAPGSLGRPDGWIDIEDGVRVAFPDASAEYRSGDYWLIPARTVTADVLWPTDADGRSADVTAFRPALYRAPLALVNPGQEPSDLRVLYSAEPLYDPDWAQPAASVNDSSGGAGSPDDGAPDGDLPPTPPPAFDPGATMKVPIATPVGATVTAADVKPFLTIVRSSGTDADIQPNTTKALQQGRNSVGRGVGSMVRLPDTSVSREHGNIAVTGDEVTVWDGTGEPDQPHVASRNGTFVNGEKISAPTKVENGDEIGFGAVRMILTIPPATNPQGPS